MIDLLKYEYPFDVGNMETISFTLFIAFINQKYSNLKESISSVIPVPDIRCQIEANIDRLLSKCLKAKNYGVCDFCINV